ncbi:hypothetical protein ACQ4LE_009873 [Meloidogyne hapla]
MNFIYFLIFIILFPTPDFLSSFFTAGFECFVCNTDSENDDTEPCIEKVEECPAGPPGTQSCSTLLYFSKRGNPGHPHMRKFCTSPGIPLGIALEKYQLDAENNIGLCQSVEQWLLLQIDQQSHLTPLNSFSKNSLPFKNHRKGFKLNRPKQIKFNEDKSEILERRKRSNNNNIVRDGSPSPPQSHSSTLLCICNKQLCNEGDFEQVLERSQLGDNTGIKNKNNKFNIEEE